MSEHEAQGFEQNQEPIDTASGSVQCRRCEDLDQQMWGCEDALQRLLFYEEPFAGALGKKKPQHLQPLPHRRPRVENAEAPWTRKLRLDGIRACNSFGEHIVSLRSLSFDFFNMWSLPPTSLCQQRTQSSHPRILALVGWYWPQCLSTWLVYIFTKSNTGLCENMRDLLDQCATLEERQFWSLAVFVRRFVWKVASTRFSLSHPPSTLTPIKKCINSPSPSTVLNPTLHVVRHCAFAAAKCGLTTDLTEAETRNLKPLCQTKPVALELCVQSV